MTAGQGAQEGKTRRVRARVRGRVQGVAYRASTRAQAQRLGVAGWVRNRADGSVEARVQGDEAALEQLLAWCGRGPRGCQVDAVESVPAEVDPGLGGFAIDRSG